MIRLNFYIIYSWSNFYYLVSCTALMLMLMFMLMLSLKRINSMI